MAVQSAVEADIEITVAGDFEFGDAFELAEVRGEFSSDDLGWLLELARKLKGNGQRDLAEIGLLRLLHCDLDIGAVLCLDEMGNCLLDTSFKDMEHGNASIARGRRYSCECSVVILGRSLYSRCAQSNRPAGRPDHRVRYR